MTFQVSERTLSPEVGKLLERFLGCAVAHEGVLPDRSQFDFFLMLNGYRIVVELKIGGVEKLPYAIAQAEGYKEKVGADGIVAIAYPEAARKEVTRADDVADIASSMSVSAVVLCPFLKDFYSTTTLYAVAQKLRSSIKRPSVAPSMELVVQTLRHAVQGIALEVKRSVGIDHPVIQETIGSLALFEALQDENADTKVKSQGVSLKDIVSELASYVLVNQILLHHIVAHNLKFKRELHDIKAPAELDSYFADVTIIDYKAVYCVDVASRMPIETTREINVCIRAIRAISPETLSHDLLGRIFHEFLPQETRKQLGTFYTRPQAAELLAGLAVESASDKVLDPACGSGTLLVAAYRKKRALSRSRSHKTIVEKDITGVDVMPFAAHLAALNLTMQSPKEPTNLTRVGVGNSLNLTVGSNVGNLAKWLQVFGEDVKELNSVSGTVARAESFEMEPVDLVIMNPPFTRKERLTEQMKGLRFGSIGNQNYWAYFVLLADTLLKQGGRIAAVLPRDIFRGEYSRAVREFLWRDPRYSLRYVVKSTRDTAFSESARFRDFLLVLRKGSKNEPCAFIYLKKRLAELSLSNADQVAQKVRSLRDWEEYQDDSVRVVWKEQTQILENWKDLGQFVAFNTEAGDHLGELWRQCVSSRPLISLRTARPPVRILRGLEPATENLLNLVFVVRPLAPARVEHSALVFNSVNGHTTTAALRSSGAFVSIPTSALKKGLKTAAYVARLDVSDVSDFAIVKAFDGIESVKSRVGVERVDFEQLAQRAADRYTHLAVARRFNLIAPGTRLLAFYSKEAMLPGKAFWCLQVEERQARCLSVWFNSTFSLIELLLSHTETEGAFIELTKDKLEGFRIPDFNQCNPAPLEDAFVQVRELEIPPLLQQFSDSCSFRWIVDQAVLKSMGYGESEAQDLLKRLYSYLSIELQTWHDLMHRTKQKDDSKDQQLHLIPGEGGPLSS